MTDEKPTQAAQGANSPQQDVKPDVKAELSHLTLTVVHQAGLQLHVAPQ